MCAPDPTYTTRFMIYFCWWRLGRVFVPSKRSFLLRVLRSSDGQNAQKKLDVGVVTPHPSSQWGAYATSRSYASSNKPRHLAPDVLKGGDQPCLEGSVRHYRTKDHPNLDKCLGNLRA